MSGDAMRILIRYERPHPSVALVTLDRPEKRNAINGEMTRQLVEIMELIDQDRSVRAVVLTSSNDAVFCAGADLVAVGKEKVATEAGGFAGFVFARRRVPWIAAVVGQAHGGGLEIALACDMIVAARDALFSLPEVKRGTIAGGGGAVRLPRLVPRCIALELLLTGDSFGAERALALGLVNRIVDAADVRTEAVRLGEKIAANSPASVAATLELARQAQDGSFETVRPLSDAASRAIHKTEDFKEGVRAFLEKRLPNWPTGS